ncbi:MAG TPA: DciA family protein [Candidatus Obscuribacterales bacterium]
MQKKTLSQVNTVLNKVVSNLGLDRRLREHTFMSLWPTFVSSAVADRSRPLFIDSERNLVISVKDAAVGQELSMAKSKLLPKVVSTARSLHIELRGLRLDLKHYHATSTMPYIEEEKPLPKPSEADLKAIELKPQDVAAVDDLRSQLTSEAAVQLETSEKIVALYERELRMRHWRFLSGFPLCPQCTNPVERLHSPASAPIPRDNPRAVCIACLYRDDIS